MSYQRVYQLLFLVCSVVFFYGCAAKAPESSMDMVAGDAPSAWSATKPARSTSSIR